MTSIPPLQAISLGADTIDSLRRRLPVAPDGQYDWELQADSSESLQGHSSVTNLINDVSSAIPTSSGTVKPDPHVLGAFLDAALHPNAVDDRKGAFMDGLTLLAHLPPQSQPAKQISDAAVTLLYDNIPHPPATSLGAEHVFRQADGGGNSVQNPDIGRAGTPYARSVQGRTVIPSTALPDPGLVFDTLIRARDRKDHPGGNSSLTFAFATLVTHSLFRTDQADWSINATSSYLDLSPLYGINQATQDLVRDKKQGRGLLFPDTFSEERLSFLPPAASALLVILNRNHNYIADMLLKINERGTWNDPPPEDPTHRVKQDEEIFQTARLVNCGHFMSLIVGDYVAGFLGISEGIVSPLLDDAFSPLKGTSGQTVTRGQGNQCSVEFNVLYRWHATVSPRDERWSEEALGKVFGAKPLDEITLADFRSAFGRVLASIDPDPSKRTFGGLVRGADGKLADDDLARILQDATESPAGAFRARGVPAAFRVIEILGMVQARRWGFLGLKQFKEFEEWNPDPEIASAARRLYGHIDNLELYVGLECEEPLPLKPGVRFSSGYTLMRAILADALALVRGDRYFTTDFTPGNLTSWGFQDCKRDSHNGGFVLPKLLMRHLPHHYPSNSVYGCFPFFTPHKMKESLTAQAIADQYTFSRPVPTRAPHVLNTRTAIKYVFSDPARFGTVYDMSGLGGGYGFLLAFDDPANWALHTLFPTKNSLADYQKWYRDVVAQKIKTRSWKYDGVPGNYIDIVKSVVNAAAVKWAAEQLCGIELKTQENPHGVFTEQEVYELFATLLIACRYTFITIGDSEHGFSSKWAATQAGAVVSALVAKTVLEVAPSSGPSGKPYYAFLSRLAETGRPWNELVANVIGLAVGSSVNYAQGAVHVLDFYLDDAREHERHQIINLVHREDEKSQKLLLGYVREGMRLNPQYCGLWRECKEDAVIPQGSGAPNIHVKAGERVWGSFKNANLDATRGVPNPAQVDPTRPSTVYTALNGTGFHGCPGVAFAEHTIVEVVKVVFRLKNLRRAPGDAGRLAGFKQVINKTETNVYLTPYGTTSPWPGSMYLVVGGDFVLLALEWN
ncbi:heme peroxidase [Mycena capillaripes]|nr:heme peroxidase [Mycena capillaripes]